MGKLRLTSSYLSIVYLLLFSSCQDKINSQALNAIIADNAVEVKSISPEDTDFSDLKALKDIIGNARIVLLGEQSHGGGSTYSAKVRLIKFLNQEMGFEVMAFESGMYDCAEIGMNISTGKKMEDEVLGSMFYMYATSTEVKPLFRYMDEQLQGSTPLLFCGMDSQHTGEKSKNNLVSNLQIFLEQNRSDIPNQESWEVFESKVADIIGMNRKVTTEDKTSFYGVLSDIKAEIDEYQPKTEAIFDNPGFWRQILNSLESQAKRYWKDIPDMDRDRQMGSNMSWLLNNTYKDKKVIIWAHNFHIARGLNPVLPMGHFLKNEFKDEMYAVGFTGFDGEFINFANDKKVTIKKPSKVSIEQSIKSLDWPYAFIDLTNLEESSLLRLKQKGRLVNFSEQALVLPNIFDGLFYIETTTPAVQE
ncbi:erythromycin esterase family protein [Flagellimonas sp. CMM7]|uniref:erythromycin esterase family protein n=1 Tax=Flagellimonas sp. CMM7 TaxID=2654676 RepID=UPI0013D737CD|nr:erythromycin esterase family protein [Flagellimonas sp. CMM7]UII80079.1 erythromycin esterase family protein [Flagellimonas sp. CMM7]